MTAPANRVSLVISDVDGTLLRSDKTLSERNRQAVAQLGTYGIGFTISSSRPPFGLRALSEKLGLRLPIGAYNGGILVAADLTVLEHNLIAPETANSVLAIFRLYGIDAWIFTADGWSSQNPEGDYVALETRTIGLQPKVVATLEDHLEGIAKMVGVSADFRRLTSCEKALRSAHEHDASIARSQTYYLDVTPARTNKGTIVVALMQRLNIPAAEIVTLGDMENDVSMFQKSGFSIAMGNANADVKHHADAVALSNDDDGFADAVERFILPSAKKGDA